MPKVTVAYGLIVAAVIGVVATGIGFVWHTHKHSTVRASAVNAESRASTVNAESKAAPVNAESKAAAVNPESKATVDAGSKAYADEAIVAISTHWSKHELMRRATPELREKVNAKPQELDKLFHAASADLGSLREYHGAKRLAHSGGATQSPVISANYVATAQYQKGSAKLRIGVVKVDGHWKISRFFIDSSAMKKPSGHHGGPLGLTAAR